MQFKFFTTPYGDYPYHLIPFKKWGKYKKKYKAAIVDCGVNAIIGKKEYPYIDQYPLRVPENISWVCPDYPYDVKPDLTQEECIRKTWINIDKWKSEPGVMLSVQYEYENIASFILNYNKLYPIANRIGIGNLCKSINMNFLRKVIDYCMVHNIGLKPIHFFGLYKPAIMYMISTYSHLNVDISVDNVKWDNGMYRIRTNNDKPMNKLIDRWELCGKPYIDEINAWYYQSKYKNKTDLTKYIKK